MKLIKAGVLLAALSMALTGCEEGATSSSTSSKPSSSTGSVSSAAVTKLATQGNLSPDAIRLQTMSMQLLTLEQEQQAAKDRSASFAAQGTGLGIAGGAIAGLLACQLAGCSTAQRNRIVVAGAVGGGIAGHQMGEVQAERQNQAAAAENAILRRLQIAGQQLDKAREARVLAERVVASNQSKLSKMQADVAAGRASKAQLDLARADAAADAVQVQKVAGVMDKSVSTMKGEQRLNDSRSALSKEETATQKSYEVLSKSIRSSAL